MSGRGSAGKRKSEGEVCITHFPLCGGRGRFVALPLRSETDASTNDDDEEETEEEGEEEGLEADGKEREDFGRGRVHGAPYLAYVVRGVKGRSKVMALVHTYTPRRMRGCGWAERLCAAAFDWAATRGMLVDPECSYVSNTFLSRRPAYKAACV
eukprot:CAMPEP_0198686602 /NCGR_PEP_ID=MMETSP1468-20131203/15105_1 /TAXON_ID=1461545 /ORGANISM="Mantoniella sp, Strain CCMP1436" /LENGTH=153 /DNA_ID=CAMNT_0044432813 /DNA_START=21 /DNA_END=482 /DNA_ORIENTATION=+